MGKEVAMVAMPDSGIDPTLEAVDRAIEAEAAKEPPRSYLGASAIGDPCERKLWYSIRPEVARVPFDAQSLKRFEDGHHGEAMMAARLRMVPGVELWTEDEKGEQFGFSDFDGKFRGHVDGVIRGIYQAPATPHIWEAKVVNEKKLQELRKLKASHGEKATLEAWDFTYYSQAQIYMHYFDLTRHYMVVSSPGGREYASCRTEYKPAMAEALREKAKRILDAKSEPARLSERSEYYICKFCQYRNVCHNI